jgi:tetratricopeptide (TPR) repeat protein
MLILIFLARTYLALADYYIKAGDYTRFSEFTELALDLSTKINHPMHQIQALRRKGGIARESGRYHECIQHHREAQKIARLNGIVDGECTNLAEESYAFCRAGNLPEAQACAAEGYELLLKKGLEGSDVELTVLDAKVEIHWQKTEYTAARQLTERMIQMTGRHRSPHFHANSVSNSVQLDLIIGMHDTVILRNLASARELAKELRFYQVMQICDFCQAELDLRNGDTMKAYTTLQILGGRTESPCEAVYRSLAKLGELSNNLCGLEETIHWATTYFAFSRKGKDLGHTCQSLRYLGDIILAQGDEESAMSIFQAVLDASTEMDVHRRRADCMSRIGAILVRRGEPEKAKEMWEAALPLFGRSSQATEAAAIKGKLAQLAPGNRDAESETSRTRGIQNNVGCLGADIPVAELE